MERQNSLIVFFVRGQTTLSLRNVDSLLDLRMVYPLHHPYSVEWWRWTRRPGDPPSLALSKLAKLLNQSVVTTN